MLLKSTGCNHRYPAIAEKLAFVEGETKHTIREVLAFTAIFAAKHTIWLCIQFGDLI